VGNLPIERGQLVPNVGAKTQAADRLINMSEFVCKECFSDEGIRAFIVDGRESSCCDFCGAKSDYDIAAPLEDVLNFIKESIEREYDDAANWLPYESAEGGYLGVTYDGDDFVHMFGIDLPNDKDNALYDAVVGHLNDCIWCERYPFSINDEQNVEFSWRRFCKIVKHERRFFFMAHTHDPMDETLAPAELLERLLHYAESVGLVEEHREGLTLYRARPNGRHGPWTTPADLGPPPEADAKQPNRMSSAGIVMFYGSESVETALRETTSRPGTLSVGRFQTTKRTRLLDLSDLPPLPSIFGSVPDSAEVDPRRAARFLEHIAGEISLPIERNDRVHIEYVPTQVVTEFVRTRHLEGGVAPIDGILYSSAVHRGCYSCVLFATQQNIYGAATAGETRDGDIWLKLTNVTQETASDADLAGWREGLDPTLWFGDDK